MDSPNAFIRRQEKALRSKSVGQIQAQKAVTNLQHLTLLDIYCEPVEYRKSSIVCTIGPKTNNVDVLKELFHAGMCVVRMNFSHGDHPYHASVIANAREAESQIPGAVLAIALDTKGPEIRTGLLAGDDDVLLEAGTEVTVTTDDAFFKKCDAQTIYVDYKNITKVLTPGKLIYVDDGLISLEVKSVGDTSLVATVVNSGMLGSKKGVNLPNVNVDLPAVSEKDRADLRFGVEQKVNMVFASFIRSAENVREVRRVLGDDGKHIKIISKIENHQGVSNFDEILEESDGIMVARGDLGIEIDAQKVFLAQKMMISKCNIAGKPVICATQMLESMTVNPRPTRAEVSDVANAVLDGSDCVMLSGESAKGKYPVHAVKMMASICREAESAIFYKPLFNQLRAHTPSPVSMTETVASSAVNASFENSASAIICLTLSGNSARLIAKYRPSCPIIVVTRNPHTARISHLYRGCFPVIAPPRDDSVEWQEDVDNRLNLAMDLGRTKGFLSGGETCVCIQGWKGGSGHTNTIRIMTVPE